MLWLALHCPTLALDCILRRWPRGLEPTLAVTDLIGNRRLIAMATRVAEAGGVFAGQSIATALALLPDLLLTARQPEDERLALHEAALAVLRFTPTVSLRTTGLLLEVSASLKLFGGRRRLRKDVLVTLRTQGLSIVTAEAPTPHGAWLLARQRADLPADRHPPAAADGSGLARTGSPHARMPESGSPHAPVPESEARSCRSIAFMQALDALPLAHLDHARPLLRRLDGIGCTTVADLRRLPVHGLARRFGPALIDELARAAGDKPDPQTIFAAPSRFDARIELMARVESADALIFAAHRLLAQLAGWLVARRAAVRGFSLVLHHERWTRDAIEPTSVPIALATPSGDLDRLVTLVRERLSRLELKAPVLELSLDVPVVVEAEEAPGRLFVERDQTTETLARLLEKLVARLGHDALTRIERVADHRPERAWRTLRGDVLDGSHARTESRLRPTVAKGPRPAKAAPSMSKPGIGRSLPASGNPSPAHSGSSARPSTDPRPDPSVDPAVDESTAAACRVVVPVVGMAEPHGAMRGDAKATAAAGRPRDARADDPALASSAPAPVPRPAADHCGPRPAWLLTEPQPLEVRLHRPCFDSLPLDLVAGPERIETGWWDDAPATRDYFIAENAAGHLVWVYRERLPVHGRPQWYLQGLFG